MWMLRHFIFFITFIKCLWGHHTSFPVLCLPVHFSSLPLSPTPSLWVAVHCGIAPLSGPLWFPVLSAPSSVNHKVPNKSQPCSYIENPVILWRYFTLADMVLCSASLSLNTSCCASFLSSQACWSRSCNFNTSLREERCSSSYWPCRILNSSCRRAEKQRNYKS